MNWLLSTVLSTSIVGGGDIDIKVDLSALSTAADDNLERWIIEDAKKALDSAGHRVTAGARHSIEVTVSWHGKDDLDTLVTVSLDGQPPTEIRCSVCDEDEWLPQMAAEVARLADSVNDPVDATPSPPKPSEEPVTSKEPTTSEEPNETAHPEARKTAPPITWLGGLGIGAGLTGIGLAAAGAYDLSRTPERTRDAQNSRLSTEKVFKRRGVVFLASGGLALAGGVAALVFDVRRQKKKRQVGFAPSVGPAITGFQLRGTF